MLAQDSFLYEYAVVRYVPRVDREEFINIGLIMLCKRNRWLAGRIHIDEDRVRAFDPKVNLENLQKQASIFTRKDSPDRSLPEEEKYRWLSAVKSAVLQVSPSHPGLLPQTDTETSSIPFMLEEEFNRLFNNMVAVN